VGRGTIQIARGKVEISGKAEEWLSVCIYGTIGAPQKGFEHDVLGFGYNHIYLAYSDLVIRGLYRDVVFLGVASFLYSILFNQQRRKDSHGNSIEWKSFNFRTN
jgi:hypothetical protein